MNLNHANIFARDVLGMAKTFEKFFAFEIEQQGDGFAMLRGYDGFSLVIVRMKGGDTYPNAQAFGMDLNFHLGFIVASASDVFAKHDDLQNGGCNPGQIKTFDAIGKKWTAFYCPIGDGIDIEVAANEDLSS